MTHKTLNDLVQILHDFNNAKGNEEYQLHFSIDVFDYEGKVEFSVHVRFESIFPELGFMVLTKFVLEHEIHWFLGGNIVHIE